MLGRDKNLQPRHCLRIRERFPRRPHQLVGLHDPLSIGEHLKRCDETVNGIFYHRRQQTIPIPEMMLDDTPTHPSALNDVPSTSRREAFLANAANRLVDE